MGTIWRDLAEKLGLLWLRGESLALSRRQAGCGSWPAAAWASDHEAPNGVDAHFDQKFATVCATENLPNQDTFNRVG